LFADDVQVYLVTDSAEVETWLTTHAPSDSNADGKRYWRLCAGMGLFETTLDLAEGNGDQVEPETLLEVNDLWECERFCNDQLISFLPTARYYASIPLNTPNGIAIEALCVLDDGPRKEGMSDVDKTTLKKMGNAVMDYLEIVREERGTKRAQEMELSLSIYSRQLPS